MECYATSDLIRVFEDGYGQPDPRSTNIHLFGLRNETASAQCVIEAHDNLEKVTVKVGSLTHADGQTLIPAEQVRWNFVGSILIQTNSPNQRPEPAAKPSRKPWTWRNHREFCSRLLRSNIPRWPATAPSMFMAGPNPERT